MEVTLFVCGDVMTGRGIDQLQASPSAPDLFEPYLHDARDYVELAERRSGPIPRAVEPAYVWGDALGELSRARPQARIVNLETSITRSNDAQPWKSIHYRMHPANVGCLTVAGIDLCVLSNNHVLDWGEAGLLETLDVLEAARIRVAGAGRSRDEAERPAVLPLARGGGHVVVVGVGHESSGVPDTWAATAERPGVCALLELTPEAADAVAERARRAAQPGDVIVASIHWGSNWGYEVPDEHVRFAHALIDRGVHLVHGHSSHHPRPIEAYGGGLIFYGCGDLLTDYEGIRGHEAYRSDLGLLYFTSFDARTSAFSGLRMVPMHTRKLRLERARPGEASFLFDVLTRISRPFGTVVERGASGEGLVSSHFRSMATKPVRP